MDIDTVLGYNARVGTTVFTIPRQWHPKSDELSVCRKRVEVRLKCDAT
jgi:hypothetical protein